MNRLTRLTALIASLVLITSALTGCGGETVKTGSEVIVGIVQDLGDIIDPQSAVDAASRELLFNIYEGLVKPSSGGDLLPAVASSYEISDGGRVFTFTLRQGIKFHNGSPVTSEDVVYSIERGMGVGGGEPVIAAFSEISSVSKLDDKTVAITLHEADIEFLAYLTAAIIPVDSAEGSEPPPGTGPFKFVSRMPQESIVIEKFPDYWGAPAQIDKVTYKIMESTETLVMALKSGAVDVVPHLTYDQSREFVNDSAWRVVNAPMCLVQAVYLNHNVPPLDDINVRKALCHAINRQGIFDIMSDGQGYPLGSSIYPTFEKLFLPELIDYYEYDPAKAREMLADAGYPDGFDLEITVSSIHTPHINTAQIVVEQLAEIGVRATIKLVDWTTWLSDVNTDRNYQSTIIGFDAKVLTGRALLDRFQSESGKNVINFANEEYDEVLAKAIASADEGEQVELYKRLQEILTEQAANLYIQDPCDYVVMNSDLAGPEFYTIFVLDMSSIYFKP